METTVQVHLLRRGGNNSHSRTRHVGHCSESKTKFCEGTIDEDCGACWCKGQRRVTTSPCNESEPTRGREVRRSEAAEMKSSVCKSQTGQAKVLWLICIS